MIAEVLKHFEGIGLLDVFMVNVDRCDSYKLCIGEAFQHDLEPIYRETTVDQLDDFIWQQIWLC